MHNMIGREQLSILGWLVGLLGGWLVGTAPKCMLQCISAI